jgi:hypothetical protein
MVKNPTSLMTLPEKKYLSEVKQELRYKDTRSVIRWCENNKVGIFSDYGSNKKYVLNVEFERAAFKKAIKYLMEKYGTDKLPEVFQVIMNFSTQYNNAMKVKQNVQKYQPQGQHEKNFLTSLLNETHEL